MVRASVGAGAARDERAWRHSFGHALGLGQAVDCGRADADRNRLCEVCEVDLCEVVMPALLVWVAMAVDKVTVASSLPMVQLRHASATTNRSFARTHIGVLRGDANDCHDCR